MFKWLFGKKCKHEVNMDNLEVLECKHCKKTLPSISYSTGGIGITDEAFRWNIARDLSSPNSTLKKMLNYEERLKKVKEQIKREKEEESNKKS